MIFFEITLPKVSFIFQNVIVLMRLTFRYVRAWLRYDKSPVHTGVEVDASVGGL